MSHARLKTLLFFIFLITCISPDPYLLQLLENLVFVEFSCFLLSYCFVLVCSCFFFFVFFCSGGLLCEIFCNLTNLDSRIISRKKNNAILK